MWGQRGSFTVWLICEQCMHITVILISLWVWMWGTGRKVNNLVHLWTVYMEVDQVATTHAVILVSLWVRMLGTGRKVNSLVHLWTVYLHRGGSGGPHLCCDPDKSLGMNVRDRERLRLTVWLICQQCTYKLHGGGSGGPHLCCDPDKSLGVDVRDREKD